MPDSVWIATLRRIRGEFEEMPCMRITAAEAAGLLGLPASASASVLDRLMHEGFLMRYPDGVYVLRTAAP